MQLLYFGLDLVLDQGLEARPSEAGLSCWYGLVGSEQALLQLVIHDHNCATSSKTQREKLLHCTIPQMTAN